MSLLKFLGFGDTGEPSAQGETETVRKIVGQLKAMPAEQARFIAGFAYILSRVAYADRKITDDEITVMEKLVSQFGGLAEAQAVLAVEIARHQAQLFGGTENYLVTREFRNLSSKQQREELLHCLFGVSAADGTIDSAEEAQIKQIANELGITNRDLVPIRAAYNDKRAVVKMGKKAADR